MEAFPHRCARTKEPVVKEILMRSDLGRRTILVTTVLFAWLAMDRGACAQTGESYGSTPPAPTGRDDVKALAALVRQLQSQVASLSDRVKTLEANETTAIAESESLRAELAKTKSQQSGSAEGNGGAAETPAQASEIVSASSSVARPVGQQQDTEERIGRLEEDLALANSKIQEQSQTKVESSSKYRVRLTGLAL